MGFPEPRFVPTLWTDLLTQCRLTLSGSMSVLECVLNCCSLPHTPGAARDGSPHRCPDPWHLGRGSRLSLSEPQGPKPKLGHCHSQHRLFFLLLEACSFTPPSRSRKWRNRPEITRVKPWAIPVFLSHVCPVGAHSPVTSRALRSKSLGLEIRSAMVCDSPPLHTCPQSFRPSGSSRTRALGPRNRWFCVFQGSLGFFQVFSPGGSLSQARRQHCRVGDSWARGDSVEHGL